MKHKVWIVWYNEYSTCYQFSTKEEVEAFLRGITESGVEFANFDNKQDAMDYIDAL